MNDNQSFKKKLKINKPLSLRFRFLVIIIFAIFAITFFIGGLCLYEVDNYIQAQAENFVKVTCDNEAAQFNASLNNMEKSVKIMESYLMDFFKSKDDLKDKELQTKIIQSADKMFIDITRHTRTTLVAMQSKRESFAVACIADDEIFLPILKL